MKTINTSLLRNLEGRLTKRLAGFVPRFIGTKILTFLCLLSSLGVVVSYRLCEKSYLYLFLASFFIIMQWIFDCLDGYIGRVRNERFLRWGYYMDHLFDYFFMSSVVFGLYYLFPASGLEVLSLFFILSSFMVTFFLMHSAAKEEEFKISFWGFSPIEFRLSIIIFNTLFYFNADLIKTLASRYFAFLNLLLLLGLVIVIYFHQKQLHNHDKSL